MRPILADGPLGFTRVLAVEGRRTTSRPTPSRRSPRLAWTKSCSARSPTSSVRSTSRPSSRTSPTRNCPVSGEVYSVGGGRVARVFIGVTPGFVDHELSPESVRDHFDRSARGGLCRARQPQRGDGPRPEGPLLAFSPLATMPVRPAPVDADSATRPRRGWTPTGHTPRRLRRPSSRPTCAPRASAWQRRLFDAGFAGIHWPVECGGRGLTPEHNAAWIEECAARRRAAVHQHGRHRARRRVDPALRHRPSSRPSTSGRPSPASRCGASCSASPARAATSASLHDPGRARRRRASSSTARRCGARTGATATGASCMARTDPTLPKHRGISFFLFDMHLPGIEIRPLRQMTGGVRVRRGVLHRRASCPPTACSAPLNGGWDVGMAALTNERGHIGAAAIALERRLAAMAAMGDRGARPSERQRAGVAHRSGPVVPRRSRRQGPSPRPRPR